MNEHEVTGQDIPEMDFAENAEPVQAQEEPKQEAAPQPEPAGQPEPSYGPSYNAAKAAYEQAQAAYKDLLAQVKKLEEVGASVPYELQAQIAQYSAELAILKRDMEDAKRRDALALVPGLVARYSANLPAAVAQAAKPILQTALTRAISANPAVVNDAAALEGIASYAVGEAIRKGALKAQPAKLPAAEGVPEPPPEARPKAVTVPPEAARYGISERIWTQVAELEMGEFVDFPI